MLNPLEEGADPSVLGCTCQNPQDSWKSKESRGTFPGCLGKVNISLSSRNICVSRFWQLSRRRKILLFFSSKRKVVSILIIHIKYSLRFIRSAWLLCFSLHFLLLKRNCFIFNLRKFLFDTDQNATFPLLTFLRLTQFSYTEMGISFNKIRNFDTLILATFILIIYFRSSDIIFTLR